MKNSEKNRMHEIENKSRSLFFLGLIAAASLTLTAFEWRSSYAPTPMCGNQDTPITLIEADMKAIQIEAETPVAEKRSLKASLTKFIISDILHLEPTEKDPEPIEKMDSGITSLKPIKELSVKGSEAALKSDEPSTLSSLLPHELPFLYTCASLKDPAERFNCTQAGITAHLQAHIRIPDAKKVPDLPGLFYVQFVIDEYGAVGELKYSKEIPKAVQTEVDNAFASIPFMQAAKVNGRNVKVIFAIPLNLKRLE